MVHILFVKFYDTTINETRNYNPFKLSMMVAKTGPSDDPIDTLSIKRKGSFTAAIQNQLFQSVFC